MVDHVDQHVMDLRAFAMDYENQVACLFLDFFLELANSRNYLNDCIYAAEDFHKASLSLPFPLFFFPFCLSVGF